MKGALLTYLSLLLSTLLSFGCVEAMFTASLMPPHCPDPPSVAWMVPKIEGQPDQLRERRMSVQGTYAPKAEITMSAQGTYAPAREIKPHYVEGDCWTTAGIPLAILTEAVSTALANAGLVQFVGGPEGSKYMLQFEVERQSLIYTSQDPDLGSCTATVDVSYSVLSVGGGKAPIWKGEITGKHTIQYGSATGLRNYGSTSKESAAIEGAVATNLSVLINKLKDLPFEKD
jgi:hypothetical protein